MRKIKNVAANQKLVRFLKEYFQKQGIEIEIPNKNIEGRYLRIVALEGYKDPLGQYIDIRRMYKDIGYTRHGLKLYLLRLGLGDFIRENDLCIQKPLLTIDMLYEHIEDCLEEGYVNTERMANIFKVNRHSIRNAFHRNGLSHYIGKAKGGLIRDGRLQNRALQEERLRIAQQKWKCETIQMAIARMIREGHSEDVIAKEFKYGNLAKERFTIGRISKFVSQQSESNVEYYYEDEEGEQVC